jgi:hypothetical protein
MEQTATGLIVIGWKLALALVAGIPMIEIDQNRAEMFANFARD